MNTSKNVVDMQHLADLAQVSRSTVSRALADSPLVNAKTKQRIQALAAEHNYVLNEAARNFRLKKTRIVSVVLMIDPGSEQRTSDPFFLEMLGSVADSLVDAGYDMLLSHTAIQTAAEFRNTRAYRQSEGVLFVGQGKVHDELNMLAAGERPIVVWGAEIDDSQYCIIGSDNRQGGFRATQHLIDCGRRSLAFFGDRRLPEPRLRFDGFLRAIDASALNFDAANELAVPFEHQRAEAMIQNYLDTNPDIDGIVCCSDVIALTAITQLNRRGLRVPDDISVTGYDNIGIASRVSPPLTTVDQHIRDAGRIMVERLLELIEGRPASNHTLETSLVERGSSRPD